MPRYSWTFGDKPAELLDYVPDLGTCSIQKNFWTSMFRGTSGWEQRTQKQDRCKYVVSYSYPMDIAENSNLMGDIAYCHNRPVIIPLYKYETTLSQNYENDDAKLYINGYLGRFHDKVMVKTDADTYITDCYAGGDGYLKIRDFPVNLNVSNARVFPCIECVFTAPEVSSMVNNSIINITYEEE